MIKSSLSDEQLLRRGLAVHLGEEMYFDKAPKHRRLRRLRPPIPEDKQYLWLVHAASNAMCLYGRDYDFVVGVVVVRHAHVDLSVFVKDFENAALVNRQDAHASYKLFGTWAPERVWVLKVEEEAVEDGC